MHRDVRRVVGRDAWRSPGEEEREQSKMSAERQKRALKQASGAKRRKQRAAPQDRLVDILGERALYSIPRVEAQARRLLQPEELLQLELELEPELELELEPEWELSLQLELSLLQPQPELELELQLVQLSPMHC